VRPSSATCREGDRGRARPARCGSLEAAGIWVYVERALRGHLDEIDLALGFEPPGDESDDDA
jgi:hypothetical protein